MAKRTISQIQIRHANWLTRLSLKAEMQKLSSIQTTATESLSACAIKYTTGRDNNFNLIRFLASILVLVSHSFSIVLGKGEVEPIKNTIGMSGGHIAVDIFFITSGFLITGSYFARGNILTFIWSRILRIYPALVVAMIFSVFILGLYFTTNTPQEYFSHFQTREYFLKNIFLFFGVNHYLPGVFANVPYEGAINDSLWTLPYEVKMYALLAIILTLVIQLERRLNIAIVKASLLLIGIAALAANLINYFYPFTSPHFIRLFFMFFIGAGFYVWRDHIYLSSKLFYVISAILLVSALHPKLLYVTYTLFLPYFVFYISYVPAGRIREFNKIGDYSYGIYIYAFPIQQSVAATMPGVSLITLMLVAFGITFLLAFMSWHIVEKNFLKMKTFTLWSKNKDT